MPNLGLHIACRRWTFLLLLAVIIASCEKEAASCFEGRGEQTLELRELVTFSHVYIRGRINVVLLEDSSDYVEVSYGSNAVGGIKTDLEGDTLNIIEINGCDWFRKIDPLPMVRVHYTNMKSLYSQSAATVSFETPFTGDSLKLEVQDASGSLVGRVQCNYVSLLVHTGATDVTLDGESEGVYIYNSGYDTVDASGLTSRVAVIHNNGSGDTYVNATDHAYTQIYLTGNIYLSGNPALTIWNDTGTGKVFRIE